MRNGGRPTRPVIAGRELGLLLGAQAGICTVSLALAGSDLPPPRGFVVVIGASIVLGLVVGFSVPWLLARRERIGVGRMLLAAAGAGAVVGVLIVAAMAVRPDLAATGVTVADVVTLAAVVGSVAAAAASLIMGVAVQSVRARSRRASTIIAVLPTALIAGPSLIIVGARLAG